MNLNKSRSLTRAVAASAITFALASPVSAQQALLQGGPWTGNHTPMYFGPSGTFGQPILGDSGPAGGGGPGVGLSELGLAIQGTGTPPYANAGTGAFGTNLCDYDAPVTNPTGYHYFCFSPNAQGGGLIAYGAAGSATQLPMQMELNGVLYQFPFTLSGIVGPNSTTVGDVAMWNNNTGTLLKDSPVTGSGSVVLSASPTFTGTPIIPFTQTGSGAVASTINAALQRVHFYPQDYGYTGASDTSNYINTCLTAAAAVNGICFLPHVPGGTYFAVSTITVPLNASLVCEDQTTSISPSISMTSLIQITANSHSGVYNCLLNNVSGFATNGLDFNPASFGNNFLFAEHVSSIGFVNNYHNTNSDEFVILNSWSQNATGYAVRSIFSGTGSRIDGLQCVNDANGIYYSPGANTTEGVIITNSNCLTANTGTSVAIQFDESLFAQISNVDVTGEVFFNGAAGAQADADINGLFISANNSVGFLALGNIGDFNLNGVTVGFATTCGIEFESGAQRIAIRGFLGFVNTTSGAADLCFNATAGGSITGVTVSDSWMTSTGSGVSSVIESGSAANLDISYLPHQTFSAATTSPRANVFPVAGAIPYLSASFGWSYSSSLTFASNALALSGTGSSALDISGTYSTEGYVDTSTAAGAINLDGTYSFAAIFIPSSSATAIQVTSGATNLGGALTLPNVPTTGASAYACFNSSNQIVKSATAC